MTSASTPLSMEAMFLVLPRSSHILDEVRPPQKSSVPLLPQVGYPVLLFQALR